MTAQQIIAKHADKIAATGRRILESEMGAQRIINSFFEDIGVNRFPRGKDDLWEEITAIQSGWEYRPPPKRLIERWRMA